MLTPLPRRRPWELANQTSTLDNLSGGRVVLPVGLGVAEQDEFWLVEDDPGRKVRAEMMDEGLAMLRKLWRGETFDFSGTYYRSRSLDHPPEPPPPPPPVQGSPNDPRIPVWVVGAWPRMKSMRRAAALDGLLPAYVPKPGEMGELTPEVLAEAVAWVAEERAAAGRSMDDYDVVVEGTTPADRPEAGADTVRAWAEAGATLW